jgi:hypothetical protein
VLGSVVEFSGGESFEMTFVALAEIWVLDWMERRVMVWVSERVVASKAIFGSGVGLMSKAAASTSLRCHVLCSWTLGSQFGMLRQTLTLSAGFE